MKKLLISLLFPGVFLFLALPVSSIRAATNTFDCKWNSTSCRAEAETYADCNDGYKVDSDYCTAITDKDSCKKATNIACVNSGSNSVTSSTSGNWYNQGFLNWYSKVYDESISPSSEIFGERYTAAQVQWILYSLPSTILNLIPGNPDFFLCVIGGSANLDNCVGTLDEGLQKILNPQAYVNSGGQSLASAYLKNASRNSMSGIGYVNNLAHKLSPISSVKAADNGIGFTVGQSMVDLWRIVRNLSYSLLVVAIIVIAFMIMFRVKINPQTVITVQSALPKLIVSMILITFSYAIAGFLIDLMYIVIGLISSILSTSNLSGMSSSELFISFVSQFDGIGILYAYWIQFIASSFLSIFTSGRMWYIGIFVLLFAVVSILAILWWSIKMIVLIIKNFATLMITIVIGPLEIMMGTITTKIGFGSWLKRMVSCLAVYPVLALIFFFSFFFLKQGITDANTRTLTSVAFNPTQNVIKPEAWMPPFGLGVGNQAGSQLIWVLVSFFIFSQATKVVEIVQSFFSGEPFDYGSAIGEVTDYTKKSIYSAGASLESSSGKITIPFSGGNQITVPGGTATAKIMQRLTKN